MGTNWCRRNGLFLSLFVSLLTSPGRKLRCPDGEAPQKMTWIIMVRLMRRMYVGHFPSLLYLSKKFWQDRNTWAKVLHGRGSLHYVTGGEGATCRRQVRGSPHGGTSGVLQELWWIQLRYFFFFFLFPCFLFWLFSNPYQHYANCLVLLGLSVGKLCQSQSLELWG